MYLRGMLIISVRTWLICVRQNARLTAGAVKTLKVAHAARSMAAMKATRIMPTTEPASVSDHRQIRYSVLLLLCWPALTIMISCCFFFANFSLGLLFTSIREVTKKPNLVTTLMMNLVYQFSSVGT